MNLLFPFQRWNSRRTIQSSHLHPHPPSTSDSPNNTNSPQHTEDHVVHTHSQYQPQMAGTFPADVIPAAECAPLLGQVEASDIPASSIFFKTTEGFCMPAILLFYIRSLLFLAMATIFITHLAYEIIRGRGPTFCFLLGNLTWFGQVLYQGFAWHWTQKAASATWLSPVPPEYAPRYSPIIARARSYILRYVVFPAGPVSYEILFSSFYVTTVTFPPVTTFLYWFFLRRPIDVFKGPSREPVADALITIIHTANSVICFTEIVFLNSIVDQISIWGDILLLTIATLFYCEVWAVLGTKLATDTPHGYLAPIFFGGGEKGRLYTPSLFIKAISVVLLFWLVQWTLHLGKGWMARTTRQNVSEPHHPSLYEPC